MKQLLSVRLLVVVAVLLVLVVACQQVLRTVGVDAAMVLNAALGRGIDTPEAESLRDRIKVPQGYSLEIFAAEMDNARGLVLTPADDVLLSQPREGKISLLRRDANGDGEADAIETLLDGLVRPHGMALYQQWLYIAEGNAIGRIIFDAATGRTSGAYQRLMEGLPEGGNHWTKSIVFGPEGWLYISVGSSCNVCEESDTRRAAILRMRPDGTALETFATGLRNSVAMAFSPIDGRFYAADISRDLLGDDFPPDELNIIEDGGFYGWPYLNANNQVDDSVEPDAEARKRIEKAIAPVLDFPAHNTPLSLHFLQHHSLQSAFPNSALVSLHGSWNRSQPQGYSLQRLQWEESGEVVMTPFVSGFLRDGEVIGRPVAIDEDSLGNVYFSDDYGRAVYRLRRGESKQSLVSSHAESGDSGGPVSTTAQQLPSSAMSTEQASGAAIFERLPCAQCHQRGMPGRLGLTKLSTRYDQASLAAFFETPTPPMPVFPLTEKERFQLASWLLWQGE